MLQTMLHDEFVVELRPVRPSVADGARLAGLERYAHTAMLFVLGLAIGFAIRLVHA